MLSTAPPDRYVVLYDGLCRFCSVQVKNLLALARPGTLEAVSFQDAEQLRRFPGLTHEVCMQAMHLVTPDGRVYRGCEAAVQALATRPWLGRLARVYYVPGIRQLCDRVYAFIAANRYRIAGTCEEGTCALHAGAGPRSPQARG